MNSTRTKTDAVKPLCIELFAGLFGWGEGFAAEGFQVIGFDIVDMGKVCGVPRPAGCELVLQDVLTLHGSQFRDAACIVASPPCQKYSYLAMPWSRSSTATCKKCGGRGWSSVTYSACVTCKGVGKVDNSQAAKALRRKWEAEGPDNQLFDACFRIQREACEAAGRYIPLIVENVRGAIPWVGKRMLADESEWFKLPEAVRVRLGRSAWNHGPMHLWGDVPALMPMGTHKKAGKAAGGWFGDYRSREGRGLSEISMTSSKSKARKMESARIAKIPFELASYIATSCGPRQCETLQ